MGQRHQVFIDYNLNNKKENIAIHDQWSYQIFALRKLARLIKFETNTNGYKNQNTSYSSFHSGKLSLSVPQDKELESANNRLLNIYNVDVDNGVYSGGFIIKENPDETDNNDGETFIDFFSEGEKPFYALTFPYEKDNLVYEEEETKETKTYLIENKKIKKIPEFFVVSARDYFYKYSKSSIEYYKENDSIEDFNNYIEEAENLLKYIEENSNLMSQEHFNNLYKDRIKSLKNEEYCKELIKLQELKIQYDKNHQIKLQKMLIKEKKIEKDNQIKKEKIKKLKKDLNSNSESDIILY